MNSTSASVINGETVSQAKGDVPMIQVRLHRPAFFSGSTREQTNVETLDQVLQLEWIKRWAEEPNFDHFAQSPLGDQTLLMAMMRDGRHWVVAYLTIEAVPLNLPIWRPR